ncbi:MAG TPA: hypothetical protein VEK07_23710 [Polyangiaceae bacterium]|nr:hypothetical protein [Polyangiaceae bacterium]
MKSRWYSISRRSAYALAGWGTLTCLTAGLGGALASCNDPTAGSNFSQEAFSASTNKPQPPGATICPGGVAAQQGPIPDAGYCNSPAGYLEAYNEDCMPGDDWIPADGGPPPPVRMFDPPPHPDTECPFYRGAYQNFMIALTPLGGSAGAGQQATDPVLVNYPTIDDAFQFTNPHLTRNTGTSYATGVAAHAALVAAGTKTGRAWLGATRQAGLRNVLVDQDDHTLYYGLHMNQAFYDFIQQNGLNTVNGILNVPQNLSLPPGLVEFKTAWKDIDPQDFPGGVVPDPPEGDYAVNGSNSPYMIPSGAAVNGLPMGKPSWDNNYITTMAWLPYLTQDSNGVLVEDPDHPILRKVALVAIHSVYTLPGHPEFIWGSIQHVNMNAFDPGPIEFAGVFIQGAPDSQPYATGPNGPALPNSTSGSQNQNVAQAPSPNNWLLYAGNTAENQALNPLAQTPLANTTGPDAGALLLDEATQSFPGQGALESVYRMFPGSKANTLEPDTAVFSLNSNLNYLYGNAIASGAVNPVIDKRFNYRLVAAVWMDKPYFFGTAYPSSSTPYGTVGNGVSLQNDDGTNPLVVGACGTGSTCIPPNPQDLYPNVSQGTFCGTPLDSTNTSGDSPLATGANNTVPGCSTRVDDLAWGDDPVVLYNNTFTSGSGKGDPNGVPPLFAAGTDYEFSLLGGEDRLSSTAMETFTQNGTFHNCFACHNTQPISTNGVPISPADPNGKPLLTTPALINVSHLFSEFVLRDAEEVCSASSIPCPNGGQGTTGRTAPVGGAAGH